MPIQKKINKKRHSNTYQPLRLFPLPQSINDVDPWIPPLLVFLFRHGQSSTATLRSSVSKGDVERALASPGGAWDALCVRGASSAHGIRRRTLDWCHQGLSAVPTVAGPQCASLGQRGAAGFGADEASQLVVVQESARQVAAQLHVCPKDKEREVCQAEEGETRLALRQYLVTLGAFGVGPYRTMGFIKMANATAPIEQKGLQTRWET